MQASLALAVTASLIHAIGFWRYQTQTKYGVSKPNFASWAIWTLLASMNALSFMAITSFVVGMQNFVGAAGCGTIFVYALAKGRFEWPDWTDKAILALCVVAIIVWKFYSPLGANMVLIGAGTLSFVPTWKEVYRDPHKERPLPWILWGSAFVFTIANVLMVTGISLKLAMPTFLILAHWSVPAICFMRIKSARRKTEVYNLI